MTVDLVAPDEALWVSWLESRDEWGGPQADQPGSALGVAQRLDLDLASRDGFGRWVQELLAQPEALPGPDIVPATNWWIVRDGRYLGAIQLRHSLNEFLADLGGHIGYGIRPSERRKGIASTALREVLTYAGDPVGLSRVLIKRTRVRVKQSKGVVVYSTACAQLISCRATSVIRGIRFATGRPRAGQESGDPFLTVNGKSRSQGRRHGPRYFR